MLLLLVPSLAQVLLVPIAPRPVGVLVALLSVVPLAWRRTRPATAAVVGSAAFLIPTYDGFLVLGYVVAAILFFSAGAYVATLTRRAARHRLGRGRLGADAVVDRPRRRACSARCSW